VAQIRVTQELAEAFVEERIARLDYPRRSNALEILVQGAEAGAVVISLLQGPVTVAQIVRAIKRWATTRPTNEALIIKGPGVDLGLTRFDGQD